jgi:hypothetical protein
LLTPDNNLINIIVNEVDDDTKKLFENYLNTLDIKYSYSKRFLIAKIFYYMIQNKINFNEGIRFIRYNISEYKNARKYIGDDVGIEQIIGNYDIIDDGDITDPIQIEELKNEIYKEIKEYIENTKKQLLNRMENL